MPAGLGNVLVDGLRALVEPLVQTLAELQAYYNDPRYWHGGLNGEGYTNLGYLDFPVNALKAAFVAAIMKPRSVLDIGCAFGFMVQHLREQGILAYGVDVSSYAMSQAPPTIKPFLKPGLAWKLPFGDQSIDLATSFGVLEHIPDDLVDQTIAEIKRVCRRGLLAITLSTDPTGQSEASHHSLHPRAWWQRRFADSKFEVWSDSEQTWRGAMKGNIVLVAPGIMRISAGMRYGGIERLVSLFSRGLQGMGMYPIVFAPQGSALPPEIAIVEAGPAIENYQEPGILPALHLLMQEVAANRLGIRSVLDFSHSHPIREYPEHSSISVIWHDPKIMQPKPPPYNVVALSEWQAERYRIFQGREARVLDPICFDAGYYKPASGVVREDRCIFVGRLDDPNKGALAAVRACRGLKQKLDLVGPARDTPYGRAVQAECDAEDIVYRGEISDEAKLYLLQRAKALLYPVSYPEGQGESHSHKGVEAMGTGCPMIAFGQGAMGEVIEDGLTGYVVYSAAEMGEAVRWVESLDRDRCRARAVERWSVGATMQRWIPVIDETCRGARW